MAPQLTRPKMKVIGFPTVSIDAAPQIDRIEYSLTRGKDIIVPPALIERNRPNGLFVIDILAQFHRNPGVTLAEGDVIVHRIVPGKGENLDTDSSLNVEYRLTRQDAELAANTPNRPGPKKPQVETSAAAPEPTESTKPAEDLKPTEGAEAATVASEVPAVQTETGAATAEKGPQVDEFIESGTESDKPADQPKTHVAEDAHAPAEPIADRIDRLEKAFDDWSNQFSEVPKLRNQFAALQKNFEQLKSASDVSSKKVSLIEEALGRLTMKVNDELEKIRKQVADSERAAKDRHDELRTLITSPEKSEAAKAAGTSAKSEHVAPQPTTPVTTATKNGSAGWSAAVLIVSIISVIAGVIAYIDHLDAERASEHAFMLAQQFMVRQTPPANPNVAPAATTVPPVNIRVWHMEPEDASRAPKPETGNGSPSARAPEGSVTIPTTLTPIAQPTSPTTTVIDERIGQPYPQGYGCGYGFDYYRYTPNVCWLGRVLFGGHRYDRRVVVTRRYGGWDGDRRWGGDRDDRDWHRTGSENRHVRYQRPIPGGPSQYKIPLGGERNYHRPKRYENGYFTLR